MSTNPTYFIDFNNNGKRATTILQDDEEEKKMMEITIVERYNMSTRIATTISGGVSGGSTSSYQLHYACPPNSIAGDEATGTKSEEDDEEGEMLKVHYFMSS